MLMQRHHQGKMFLPILLTTMLLVSAWGFLRPLTRVKHTWPSSGVVGRSLFRVEQSSQLAEISAVTDESIRKWFLKNNGRRPEVFISESSSKIAIIAEAWKSVLTSFRIMEGDISLRDHTAVYAFPNVKLDGSNDEAILQEYNQITEVILRNLNQSSPLFQSGYARGMEFQIMPGVLLLCVDIQRVKSQYMDLEDLELYVPPVEDALTNDIENFPFPTIFDFISEINRPVDPFTMSELRFKFKIQDFKYDLTKMAKKKNPQEVVDAINCKLTRLQNWRDILAADDGSMPDPFAETSDWSARIKMKYQSLKALAKADPKKALETQYDKKKTFIKIIDLWSDRLKRAFKFIYQSQRTVEDFITPILNSKWRNEVINTTKLFAQVPFLDLEGPSFEPGTPPTMFSENRVLLWGSDYSVEQAMSEVLLWNRRMESINNYLGITVEQPGFSYLGPIALHTYSRGFITERTMFDFWQGLSRWLGSVTEDGTGEDEKGISRAPAGNTLTLNVDQVLEVMATLPSKKKKIMNDGRDQRTQKSYVRTLMEGNDDPISSTALSSSTNDLSISSDLLEKSSEISMEISSSVDTSVDTKRLDHTEEFLSVLRGLNVFTRNQSMIQAKSVKELYRDWFHEGRELSEWWTTTVRNLDLVVEMGEEADKRVGPWSAIMSDVLGDEMDSGNGRMGQNSEECGEDAVAINKEWVTRYKPLMKDAEKIESMLPWRGVTPPFMTSEGLDAITTLGSNAFNTETVHVSFAGTPTVNPQMGGFLLVLPRYFRGLRIESQNEELNAFLEFCKLISVDMRSEAFSSVISSSIPEGHTVEVVPLHPFMINQKGLPDYARRSPHPAVLLRLIKA